MKSKFYLLFLFILVSDITGAQCCGYAVTDSDGFTNVRKEPNVKSEVLGKLTTHHIFSTPESSCYNNDIVKIEEKSNWLPILLNDSSAQIGYVYKQNVSEITLLPSVRGHMIDSLQVSFLDKYLKVVILLETNAEYRKKHNLDNNKDFVVNYSMYSYLGGYSYYLKQIKILINSRLIFNYTPKYDYQIYYFPGYPFQCLDSKDENYCNINLYKNKNGLYYLHISGGDGGDAFSETWIIEKDKVLSNGFMGHCEFFDVVLDR